MRAGDRAVNRVRAAWVACAALALAGCGGDDTTVVGDAGAGAVDGGDPDPDPALSADDRAALAALSPATLPPPSADASNRFADDDAAATLGQRFFFDPGFSGRLLDGDNDGSPHALGQRGETGKVSCAGCHIPSAGFLDDRTLGKQISLGAGWGRRRAPSLLDVGQARVVMWDGRHDALYNQPFGPLESPVEMNSSRLFVAEQIFARYRTDYEAVFGALPPLDDAARFPALSASATGCTPQGVDPQPTCDGTEHGVPGDQAEFDGLAPADRDAVTRVVVNFGKALGAYERRLACGASRFDAWMHGDQAALSRAEQRGAGLFVGKGRCVTCHAGPFLSDQKFHNVGLKPKTVAVVFLDDNDHGAATGLAAAAADPLNVRGAFSDGDDGRLPQGPLPASLEGAFRTPMLRCVAERPSFMHTGQLTSLEQVVAHFDAGGDRFGYPGANELTPLGLDDRERADLTAFLRALTGPGPAESLQATPTLPAGLR